MVGTRTRTSRTSRKPRTGRPLPDDVFIPVEREDIPLFANEDDEAAKGLGTGRYG